jgi:hypothetical protein
MTRAPAVHRLASRVLVAGAIALVVAGTVLLGVGLHGGDRALPPPAPSAAATHATVATVTTVTTLPTAVPLSTVRSVPIRLRIPVLGMSVSLMSLGENADGTVQVPPNDRVPGWFDLGPTPGEIGSSVILGHVDNTSGPGVFFTLRTLTSGDPVFVDLADGGTVEFVVNSVATYTKTGFPAQRVYGSHGSSALQLVTCGGVFDHSTGSYLSNIVVYTSLVAVTPPPAPTG